ncbi:MAIN-LIKE 2-like protein [Drosera capensis]
MEYRPSHVPSVALGLLARQMELYAFNPGPLDESVLYDQEKHVSSAVWEGQERGALRCHEHTSKLDQWSLNPAQIELINKAGFGYLRLIPAISLDNPLISALVERWHRETNTFHLNVGEMTVTLEDVAYLLGLAVDGEPVIGFTYTTCETVCKKFLGRFPDSGYTSGGMVKLSWLKECFSYCPPNVSAEDIEYHTRAYLLYLVGSTIFSTTTGNKVPVMYLPLFENFEQCGKYAWGAAALAFLYRALGNASLRSQSTVSGSLTLLQCWSYYHLNIGRPKLTQDPYHDQFPLVLRWKGRQSGPTANRDITFYRKSLDSLKPTDVEWHPYKSIDPRLVPDDIARGLMLGRSKTMLICFDKAERHLPDRCLRQYGFRQPIPPPISRWERKSRGVDDGVDLSGKMEAELREWSDRHLQIVRKDETVDDSVYMHWYLKITRRFVGRPIPLASEFQRMNATLREVAHIADTLSLQGLDNEQIRSVTRISYIVHECLRDQAGSVVAVASVTSEDENGKRGRGKEKVRRKGMTKRRRKDEGEIFQGDNRDDELLPNPSAAMIDYVRIPHQSEAVDKQQLADVCFARYSHTTNTDMTYQIGDPRVFTSVSEIEDSHMCLGVTKVDDGSEAYASSRDCMPPSSSMADYGDSLQPTSHAYNDPSLSSEANRIHDSHRSHAGSDSDDQSPSLSTMLSGRRLIHRCTGNIPT